MRTKILTLVCGIIILLIPASAAAYTVQPGDTLSKIAYNNNVSLAQIEAANTQISDYNRIYLGQNITIPGSAIVIIASAPVTTPVVSADSYLNYIFNKESGNNPYAINQTSKACGLGQSWPCSKLLAVCGSLSNTGCQVSFFNNYAISTYGSTANAYNFWQAHRWW